MQKDLPNIEIGLVLSGGGAKGAYEVGVYKALKELELVENIKVISGTSIGAVNGLLFSMDDPKIVDVSWGSLNYSRFLIRQEESRERKIGKLLEKIKSINIETNILEQVRLYDIGLLSQRGIKEFIDEYVDVNLIKSSNKDLYATAYNIDEEKPEYFKLNECNEEELKLKVLASCAIPHLFKPLSINGIRYADGGIQSPLYSKVNVDNVPLYPMKNYDLDIILVIHLSYRNKINKEGFKNNIIEIYPSEPLEILSGIGALRLKKDVIERNIQLGYKDAIFSLAPLVIKLLKGKDLDKVLKSYNEKNFCLE